MIELIHKQANVGVVDSVGRSVLHLSLLAGNFQNFEYLLICLPEINQEELLHTPSHGGITPLMLAVMLAHEQSVLKCLEASMNPYTADYLGRTSFDYARALANPGIRILQMLE